MSSVIGRLKATYADYTGEKSSFNVNAAVLTAANFDAQMALKTAFLAAVGNVVIGRLLSVDVYNETLDAVSAPNEPTAQVELGWRVDYVDDTTFRKQSVTIAAPLMSLLDANDRAHAEIGDGADVDDFIAAWEAYAVTKDGNAPTVSEITLVGRNR